MTLRDHHLFYPHDRPIGVEGLMQLCEGVADNLFLPFGDQHQTRRRNKLAIEDRLERGDLDVIRRRQLLSQREKSCVVLSDCAPDANVRGHDARWSEVSRLRGDARMPTSIADSSEPGA